MKGTPYWLETPADPLPSLEGRVKADAVVIGGGVAGLTAAQLLAERGREVVVLERDTCGSGATGRSSGFMTPDSELQLGQLARRFGNDDAARLWRAASAACEHVRTTLQRETIDCDYLASDSLYVAIGSQGRSSAEGEHDLRRRLGLPSTWYQDRAVAAILGGGRFEGGMRYGGTFAITPHRYAVGLRDRLREKGVRIFERSAVESVDESRVSTSQGTVECEQVFFCADHDLSNLGHARTAAYHAQTFIAATDPLPRSRRETLFPSGDLLVWDTDLIYHYFRWTADNRFLLGGGLLRKTYAPQSDPVLIINSFRTYLRERLPAMEDISFSSVWSGLIGVTKDLLPLAGRDARRPAHFYAGCAAGIPWSVLAARCAVALAVNGASEFQKFFDPHRAFTDLDVLQPVLRKAATFALSHAYAKSILRGSSSDVKRRRPWVIAALLAPALALLRRQRRNR
jgi:gamma-glutamylputrescine oxidase